jgi:hypothetical protein
MEEFLRLNVFNSNTIPVYMFCGSILLSSKKLKHWVFQIGKLLFSPISAAQVAHIINGKLFGDTASYLEWKAKAETMQTGQRNYQFQLSYSLNSPAMLCWVNSEGLLSHFYFVRLPSDSETCLLFEQLTAGRGIVCYRFSNKLPSHINDILQEVCKYDTAM